MFNFVVIGFFSGTSNLLAAVALSRLEGVTHISNLDFLLRDPTVSTTIPIILFGVGITRVAVFLAMFLLSRTFLGLFDSFLEFREAFHKLSERIGMVFLTIAVAFCSNGCLSVETLFKSPIFLVLMALTGIEGRVRAPMFLAQRAAFLGSHLFRDTVVRGTTTLALTFLALSSGFLGTFLFDPFLGVGICYYFFGVLKNAQ